MSATAAAVAPRESQQATQQTTQQVSIVPLSRYIAADVIGVDLSAPISDEVFRQIHDAWMQHMVLRFRGQNLTKDSLLDFSRRFGKLDKAPINITGKNWI